MQFFYFILRVDIALRGVQETGRCLLYGMTLDRPHVVFDGALQDCKFLSC